MLNQSKYALFMWGSSQNNKKSTQNMGKILNKEVGMVVWLRTPVFWDMVQHLWVIGS
jgi:hypothetical protein